jgi:predicted component of type VI protein secretion system
VQLKLFIKKEDSAELSEATLDVQDRVVIGRHVSSPLLLSGEALSRQHFALAAEGENVTLENLSSNGTWLNGAALAINETRSVQSGDTLEVPGHEIRVEWMTAEVAGASTAATAQNASAAKDETPAWKKAIQMAKGFFDPIEILLVTCALASTALAIYYFTS